MSEDRVWRMVFEMATDSMTGPNRFNAAFYQKCWEIIKIDIVEAVRDFLSRTSLLLTFMASPLAFIPKVKNPSPWSDFRPINLCNATSMSGAYSELH
ncbi:UNVERIFIED_CONTAM: hypothetical protein Scaly_1932500 [Sesamum calycinum]|uniref:Uncharacterized protein n=1 Tax=Sesamum calycinum TaxID=2727403 RepID=A0AAW2NIP5_9LAMI